ncbi:STAS domain-containing protein [Actinomadura sp. NTSP31]|uniref:STAS domain-containing protein n=1 Tax=Actinomadura sp. NTSP31 TaxID=1735447 RepID=UPI0035C0819C
MEPLRIVRTAEPAGLALTGELDAARHAVFARALESALAELPPDREFHLDLSGLDFIDLGGICMLGDAAWSRVCGAPVVLDRTPPQVRAVLETVGWGSLPGLCFGEPAT